MKSKKRGLLGTTFFCGTVLTGLTMSAAMGGVVHAQEAAPKAEEATEITVVGSRIRKDTFNSASPITVITREESTAAGLVTTTSVLQSTSVTNGSSQINNAFGGFVTNGGPGANSIGLRGLGEQRTLVMINGRRLAPAGTRGSVGAANLNVLPDAIVGRIEVLKDGASAIYGSDAIGGVINVITRKVDKLTIEGTASVPVHGGGEEYKISAVDGRVFGRFKIMGSLEYTERTDLTLGDRDWTSCNTDYRFNRATGATTDYIDPLTGKSKCYPITGTGSNGVTINTLGTPTFAGVAAQGNPTLAGYNRWRPNSAVTTGLVGFEGVSGGSSNVRDTFDPRTLNRSLISPYKNINLFTQASYQLPEFSNSELYGELLVSHVNSSQVGYRQLSLDYPTGSLLIPANIAAIPGSFLPAGGTTLFAGTTKARAFIGFGNDKSSQESNFTRALGGIRGDVPWFAGWEYDASVMYQKADASYTSNSFLLDRVSQSVQVSTPVAGVPANLIKAGFGGAAYTCNSNNASPSTASCVPSPVLNAQTIAGVLPADYVNYIFQPVTGTTQYTSTTFSLTADGDLFSLPAGPIKAAIGLEYRKDKINDQPPLDSVNNNLYNLTSAAPTVGEDAVTEIFGEVQIPVFKDLPFAKTLNLELASRYTEYDSYGGDSVYKAGIVYTPFSFFTLRATQGTSFRAPAVYEQYLGGTSGFLSNTGDPCNSDRLGASPYRAANCAAEGLPTTFQANQSIKVVTAGGAAQGLQAETSDNLTIGAILRSDFLPKAVFGQAALAIDYFDIKINNGVDRAGAANLLALCYDDPQFRSGGGYCNYSSRAAGSNALTVNDNYTNIAKQTVKGYDYTFRWERDFGKANVLFNAKVTKFIEQGQASFPDDPLDDYNGTVTFPEYSGNFDVAVKYGKYRYYYGVEYVGKTSSYELYGLDEATTPFIFDTDSYFMQSASVQYKGTDWTATLGVRNLEDINPPQISSGLYNRVGNAPLYSGYDFIGRRIYLNFTRSF